MPIHLAIDGNEANVTHRVGSNVYAFEILRQLELLTADQTDQVQVTVLLANQPVKDLPATRPGWVYRVIKPRKFWTQWALPIHLFWQQQKYDVFFTPGHYAPRLCPIPYVSSVMDLAFLKYPEQFRSNDLLQLKNWTEYSVKNAAKVIAISQATKDDVIKQYGKTETDVVVAYPAVEPPSNKPSKAEQQKLLKKLGIDKPYIVYIGTLQPRKNLIKLVEAFESVQRSLASKELMQKKSLKKRQPTELQLVIAGKIGWLADETVERIKNSPAFADILMPGYVDDETKIALLAQAQASVLVGLYEGFGIPPLESMHLGTIPIVSNTTSLPEVVGEAGVLVDPESHHSIADGIKKVLSLTAKGKAKYRREMRKQVKEFSWRESGAVVLETLLGVAKSRS